MFELSSLPTDTSLVAVVLKKDDSVHQFELKEVSHRTKLHTMLLNDYSNIIGWKFFNMVGEANSFTNELLLIGNSNSGVNIKKGRDIKVEKTTNAGNEDSSVVDGQDVVGDEVVQELFTSSDEDNDDDSKDDSSYSYVGSNAPMDELIDRDNDPLLDREKKPRSFCSELDDEDSMASDELPGKNHDVLKQHEIYGFKTPPSSRSANNNGIDMKRKATNEGSVKTNLLTKASTEYDSMDDDNSFNGSLPKTKKLKFLPNRSNGSSRHPETSNEDQSSNVASMESRHEQDEQLSVPLLTDLKHARAMLSNEYAKGSNGVGGHSLKNPYTSGRKGSGSIGGGEVRVCGGGVESDEFGLGLAPRKGNDSAPTDLGGTNGSNGVGMHSMNNPYDSGRTGSGSVGNGVVRVGGGVDRGDFGSGLAPMQGNDSVLTGLGGAGNSGGLDLSSVAIDWAKVKSEPVVENVSGIVWEVSSGIQHAQHDDVFVHDVIMKKMGKCWWFKFIILETLCEAIVDQYMNPRGLEVPSWMVSFKEIPKRVTNGENRYARKPPKSGESSGRTINHIHFVLTVRRKTGFGLQACLTNALNTIHGFFKQDAPPKGRHVANLLQSKHKPLFDALQRQNGMDRERTVLKLQDDLTSSFAHREIVYDCPMSKYMTDFDIRDFLKSHCGCVDWSDVTEQGRKAIYRTYPRQDLPRWESITREDFVL